MRRRTFMALLGGAAVWPIGGWAQQAERMRRIGILTNLAADDPEAQKRMAAFTRGLEELGWTIGRNVRVDYRSGAGDAERIRQHAKELVADAPEVILANASPSVAPLLQATRTVPIVFVNVIDPVGAGFVTSLARPGSNATGFAQFEFGIGAKWLELLKEIAPAAKTVAILRDPTSPTGIGQLAAIQAVAPSFGVELSPIGVQDPAEMERALLAFARSSTAGLIVTPGSLTILRRKLIIALAARQLLPAIYPLRFFTADGGLISYGPDATESSWRAAAYVDRILKGEKPNDLPVQAETKYELVINLRSAKALGLDIPQTLLARADEVIE
jgi:putative ABC transport system substrate-binding protein